MEIKQQFQKPLEAVFEIISGGDLRKFEPKRWLNFATIDKSIQELRAIYKAHPEWFEVPKPKSVAGKNEVDYPLF